MLNVESISIRYDQKDIVKNCSFSVGKGEVMSIIGPNGSGKSTLLKAVSGSIPYHSGAIRLEGAHIKKLHSKQIAKTMCMLSQRNEAPTDMTVEELVSYGRYPHKKWYEKLNGEDMEIVKWAMEKTYLSDYSKRKVSSLSGGESQRAWIAMALCQRPKILLLDEPTTYLDISHQHEVLELVRELNEEMKMTIIMVLHDLNQASKYSDQVLVIQNGEKKMCGAVHEVMTENMIRDVYRMDAEVEQVALEKRPRIHLICTCKDECVNERGM